MGNRQEGRRRDIENVVCFSVSPDEEVGTPWMVYEYDLNTWGLQDGVTIQNMDLVVILLQCAMRCGLARRAERQIIENNSQEMLDNILHSAAGVLQRAVCCRQARRVLTIARNRQRVHLWKQQQQQQDNREAGSAGLLQCAVRCALAKKELALAQQQQHERRLKASAAREAGAAGLLQCTVRCALAKKGLEMARQQQHELVQYISCTLSHPARICSVN